MFSKIDHIKIDLYNFILIFRHELNSTHEHNYAPLFEPIFYTFYYSLRVEVLEIRYMATKQMYVANHHEQPPILVDLLR